MRRSHQACPAGVEEEEEVPPSTYPASHPMKPAPSAREEERCGGGWSFPPRGAREEERCGGGG
jgi:hypothetical protein